MQNFDPVALTARVNEIETVVKDVLSIVQPLAHILRPFLPSSVENAVDEIPQLVAEMERLKEFINTELPQFGKLIDHAAIGDAARAGLVDPDLKAVTLPGPGVGAFIAPPNPATDKPL